MFVVAKAFQDFKNTESLPILPAAAEPLVDDEWRNPRSGEIGGPRGPEPTRYGDWEKKGRVSDF